MSSAAIYGRISQDRNGQLLAVERQLPPCREILLRFTSDEPRIYDDGAISSTTGKRRDEYQRLLADITAGLVKHLAVWHIDRLLRDRQEGTDFLKLTQGRGIVVVTPTGGYYDMDSPDGRKGFTDAVNAAAFEGEHKSDRQKGSFAQAAAMGVKHAGRRQFGYSPKTVPEIVGDQVVKRWHVVPEEARLIQDAVQAKIDGASDASIWKDWNRREIKTSRGNAWVGVTFRQMLQSPTLAGLRMYKGELVATKGNWPAIVSEESWREVQRIFADPKRKTMKGPTPRHLLGGIARCQCGTAMKSGSNGPKDAKYATYRCSTQEAGHPSIPKEQVDIPVREALVTNLWERRNAPPRYSNEDSEALTVLRGERDAIARRRAAVYAAIEDDDDSIAAKPTLAGLKAKLAELDKTITSLETEADHAKIMDAEMRATLAGLVGAPRFEEVGPGERRFNVARSVLESIMRDRGVTEEEAIARWAIAQRFEAMELEAKRNLIKRTLNITIYPRYAKERVVITAIDPT